MRIAKNGIYNIKNSEPSASESWYAGMGANPMNLTDPNGDCPNCPPETYLPLAYHVYKEDIEIGDKAENGREVVQIEHRNSGLDGAINKGKAITFNPAGLSDKTKSNLGLGMMNSLSKTNIIAFVVEGEAVSYFQSLIGLKAEGYIIELKASYPLQYIPWGWTQGVTLAQTVINHTMSTLKDAFYKDGYGKHK